MTQTPIRYGVAGLGRSGWNIHVNQIRPREDAKLVAVVDPLPERRDEAAEEFGCETYEHIEPMLAQNDLDVVVVATPSIFHGRDSIMALKAGKHVICEKPMAMSLAEADRMIEQAKAVGRYLFIHQNYRFQPKFTHLKSVVESGQLGRLYHIRNYNQGFSRRDDWQTLAKNGGGVLNNKCSHNLDIILQLLGAKVVDVLGDLQQIASAGDVEDHVKAFLRAENGCTADMEVTGAQNIAADLPEWVLCGTYGTLTCTGKESTIRWFDPEVAGEVQVLEGAAKNRAYGSEAPPLQWQEEVVEAVGPDVGNFYDNVADVLLRDKPMMITPESVRELIRVMDEIRAGTAFAGFPANV
jgi:scyllo-inositol 2-dehydrogenase (NADP+)